MFEGIDSWESFRNKALYPLLVNLVAATITYFYTTNIISVLLILAAGILGLAFFNLRVRSLLNKKLMSVSIAAILPYMSSRRPVDVIPVNSRITDVKRRFVFMGVSAKSLWDSDLFAMMSDQRNRECSFRFLLLDPDGKAISRRVTDESAITVEAVQHDIRSFVWQLVEIKRNAPTMNVEARYYDFSPVFWLLLCDDLLYVQTFPKGTIGRNSPLLILQKEEGERVGFFDPFLQMLNEVWFHHSKPVSLNT